VGSKTSLLTSTAYCLLTVYISAAGVRAAVALIILMHALRVLGVFCILPGHHTTSTESTGTRINRWKLKTTSLAFTLPSRRIRPKQ